jgi:flavin reductase (DIM6/NTAB) family NADH-FMN oxidoreductase RutF
VIVDPSEQDYRDIYKLMVGVIVPPPIAFVSTISPDGIRNLAPFRFFTGISANPPVICFSPMIRGADPDKLHPIGRMGGPTYTRTTDRFDMVRPKGGEIRP